MPKLRTRIRSAIRRTTGYDIHKAVGIGDDVFGEIKRLIDPIPCPVIFDIGANTGQTTSALLYLFPHASIHAFEPNPTAFRTLESLHSRPNVRLNSFALGSIQGLQQFFENEKSDLSSLLPLGPDGSGRIIGQFDVPITTVDAYCSERRIDRIELLKSDTQGGELAVIEGSSHMLREQRVLLVLLEVSFTEQYKEIPGLDRLYRALSDFGYEFVSFYNFNYHRGRAAWADALFAKPGLLFG